MFVPSDRIWQEMQYEPTGFWPVPINSGDGYAFLLKIPTHVIKAAYRSAPVKLYAGIAKTPVGAVFATVLSIADDPKAPFAISGVHRHEEEQQALKQVLRAGHTPVIFFDEIGRPVARASCVLGPDARGEALALIERVSSWYMGAWLPLLAEVLDEVDASVDPTRSAQRKFFPTVAQVALTLGEFQTANIITIGAHEAHDFHVDDSDEGCGLEQTTWQLMENLFAERIFRSPQVVEQHGPRELTDILGICELGCCLVEAKAIAVLTTSMDRSTERRAKNIRKQIDKGVAQLVGALRGVSAGLPLLSKAGERLDHPDVMGPVRVGVVMVSELFPSVDWDDVARQLIEAARVTNAFLLVLDLQELRFLVGMSKTPGELMAHLERRFEFMLESGSALIRTRLDGPPLP